MMNPFLNIKKIGPFSRDLFDAIALMNIYFFCDLGYPSVRCWKDRKKILKRIQKAGYGSGIPLIKQEEDRFSDLVYDLYAQGLELFVPAFLPDGWEPSNGYYGERCFSNHAGLNSPKNGLLCGDSPGHYRTFSCSQAVVDSLEDALQEFGLPTPKREDIADKMDRLKEKRGREYLALACA